jgi:acyl carrier protein phosphodiesterase
MNHVAHCLLSFGDEDTLLGNFIADFVKGSRWRDYPPGVQRGILLHRHIDAFTDSHAATHECTALLRPYAKRYAGPVTDILFDHLLVKDWLQYVPDQSFLLFKEQTYAMLARRAGEMPENLQRNLPKMIEGDFIHTYGGREGMEWVMERFSRRIPGGLDEAGIMTCFWDNLAAFEEDFQRFFPELAATARNFASCN